MSKNTPDRMFFDGLLKHCARCTEQREALKDFNVKFAGFILVGTEPDPEFDSDLNRKGVKTFGPWEVECTDCRNTGIQLTKKGMRLLGTMGAFHDLAEPWWANITDKEIEEEQQIPF